MADKRKTKLGILFGGRSGEHEVSLNSAASVISALDPERFEITAIGITRNGKLASTAEVRNMLPPELHDRVDPYDALVARNSQMRISSGLPEGRDNSHGAPEIIFPLLHGPYGEDGTIQGLLEIAGLPYIGCGVLASAVGMDKDVMKRLFVMAGLPVLPFRVVRSGDLSAQMETIQRSVEKEFGYPVFSKPANLGSSVGVCRIESKERFSEALHHSAEFDRKILIEKGIDAREIECAVLGNDVPEASGVGEVIPRREFYDYQAKYKDPETRLEIPACIPHAAVEEVRSLALSAFRCIDGSGLARVDFFLERSTGKVWLNEINTMPGFTPISMYPKLWAAMGVTFEDLIDRLINLGLERYHERCGHRISVNP